MADVSQIRLPNGDTFDLIDEKSGYITAQYIENKTDYSIPVSRVGEIVVGETAIGTDSTNFPTSKAVVDYVDERVVQEIGAIDVGVTGIKANGTSLSVVDGVVNIPAIGPNQSVGLMTEGYLDDIYDYISEVSGSIPTSTSQLTNDSGFITASDVVETDPTVPAWAKAATKPTYTAAEVGALPSSTVIPEDKIFIAVRGTTTYNDILAAINAGKVVFCKDNTRVSWRYVEYSSSENRIYFINFYSPGARLLRNIKYLWVSLQNEWYEGTWVVPYKTSDLTNDSGFITASDIPTNISFFTNDSGYLTASDIASVLTYKGTRASYSALPSSGNSTGDVWHITDTGAEYAWDGSVWQELGTAIDLSGYVPVESRGTAGTRVTQARIKNENGRLILAGWDLDSEGYLRPNYNGLVTINYDGVRLGYYTDNNSATTSFPIIVQPSGVTITKLITPTSDTDAANKKYVDDLMATIPTWAKASSKPTYTAAEVGALPASTIIPSKTSDLTNDSGFITSYTDENVKQTSLNGTNNIQYLIGGSGGSQTSGVSVASGIYMNDANPSLSIGLSSQTQKLSLLNTGIVFNYSEGNKQGHLRSAVITTDRVWTLPDKTGTIALTSDLPDTSSFLTSETDPVFSASAAAGITSTDISNWNAKVSDDKTWNGVGLNSGGSTSTSLYYVPVKSNTTLSGNADWFKTAQTPTAYAISRWDGSSYLYSTTPSANDNSTKVATTAYVDNAIPKVYSSTNTNGYLTMATLPIYDGTVE